MWYEVYEGTSTWDIYKVTENGGHYTLFKRFKTRKGAENWAKKQWYLVHWH